MNKAMKNLKRVLFDNKVIFMFIVLCVGCMLIAC